MARHISYGRNTLAAPPRRPEQHSTGMSMQVLALNLRAELSAVLRIKRHEQAQGGCQTLCYQWR